MKCKLRPEGFVGSLMADAELALGDEGYRFRSMMWNAVEDLSQTLGDMSQALAGHGPRGLGQWALGPAI